METKYKIIAFPISEYMTNYTKDPKIKSVLSCTIIDQRIFMKDNNILKKSVKQILDILSNFNSKIGKYIVTVNKIFQNKTIPHIKYDSELSGYARLGKPINSYGLKKNIAIVGIYNVKGITTINTSLDGVFKFLKEELIDTNKFDVEFCKFDDKFLQLNLIIFILFVYFTKKIIKNYLN